MQHAQTALTRISGRFPAGVTNVYSRQLKHGHPIYTRFCNLISASHGNLTLQNVPFINKHVVDFPAKPKKHKHCCQLPLAQIIPLTDVSVVQNHPYV